MVRNIIVFILLFLSAQFAAQPGGGGGLRVLNVYDEHKRPIDVEQLKVKLLKLDSITNIVAEYDIPSERNFYVGSDGKKMINLGRLASLKQRHLAMKSMLACIQTGLI